MKLMNKPTTAYLTELAAAGYGISYETNSGNAEYHRLPTKDAEGNDVYSDVPVDLIAITKLAKSHIDQEPELTVLQAGSVYSELDLDEHLPVLIKAIKATDKKRASKLSAQFAPTRSLIYSKFHARLQNIKAEMKIQFPLVDFDKLYSATNLKSAWASALTID